MGCGTSKTSIDVSAIKQALQDGDAEALARLIPPGEEDMDIGGGFTPLIFAPASGPGDREACTKVLLERGATVSKTVPEHGFFPLFMAAEGGEVGAAKLLLEAQADPKQANPVDGAFPLQIAEAGLDLVPGTIQQLLDATPEFCAGQVAVAFEACAPQDEEEARA